MHDSAIQLCSSVSFSNIHELVNADNELRDLPHHFTAVADATGAKEGSVTGTIFFTFYKEKLATISFKHCILVL